jgi:His/Glu/Gln/Arg/opine family amino acid ABC transporter permease subunit
MLSLLLDAAWMTLGLALASLVGGMALALAFSAAELSKRSWLVWPVATLTTLIRGLPELLVVLFIYFGSTQVLLFDEPTAALDPEITKEVAEIIRTLSQTGITQVVVTHEVEFARKVASQVIYLEKGRIIESGTAAIFQSPQTSRFAEFLMH